MATPARLGLRAFRQSLVRQPIQRRTYASATETAGTGAVMPNPAVANESALTKFWNSPIGPKTVHFWAPIMKWGVVLAGAADFARPASALSITQNMALMATGAIWTRWCFVIKPRNMFLASVNFLLFTVGAMQTTRVLLYQRELKAKGLEEVGKDEMKREVGIAESIAKDPAKVVDAVKGTK
ncbi:hypothetical protein LTR56_016085 [Elasticomyces elasticus]|nr:hypothetical protein LTR56_016085 [Elasticomyces elasticus]KAK3653817.1 hypothetical protein LTR22_011032 [Elasticomyces elasticus]KAK4916019.1 hypothetical protein LTR49_015930 [Elasticomyces elasticus]KAK5755401.1 hypothetical protein LTS12_014508 [Elasticomyces elasticus]